MGGIVSEHIHFIGIGGIGVSALARVMLARGAYVTGSDRKCSDLTKQLESEGILLFYDQKKRDFLPDKVVYSTAILADNEEFLFFKKNKVPLISRGVFLSQILTPNAYVIAVAGSHGKTTTTALLYHLLASLKKKVSVVLGGLLNGLCTNAVWVDDPEVIVVETDEHDASFLHIKPHLAIVTNIDREHLEFYQDMNALENAFITFLNQSERAIVCADDPILTDRVLGHLHVPYDSYSVSGQGRWLAEKITFLGDLQKPKTQYLYTDMFLDCEEKIEIPLAGEYNVKNSLAALGALSVLDYPVGVAVDSLPLFQGVERRFDYCLWQGIRVIHDYAHHPTEIIELIRAIRPYVSSIFTVFQPHLISRTRLLCQEFAKALSLSCYSFCLPIYRAREIGDERALLEDLQSYAREDNGSITCLNCVTEALAQIALSATSRDVILLLGAGNIGDTYKQMERDDVLN